MYLCLTFSKIVHIYAFFCFVCVCLLMFRRKTTLLSSVKHKMTEDRGAANHRSSVSESERHKYILALREIVGESHQHLKHKYWGGRSLFTRDISCDRTWTNDIELNTGISLKSFCISLVNTERQRWTDRKLVGTQV